MKSKNTLILFSSLILVVGHLTTVAAVTDAELEALEKQIEQLESEEKRQAEAAENKKAEGKRKAEQKRKAEAEMEKKRLAEQKRIEEARLAELERQRKEKEAKKRAEEERKEKYNLLIAEAKQAINDKDKELAISKYNEALTITPGDPVANSGIKEAEKLKHKVCYEVLGAWQYPQAVMDIKEDGTFAATGIADSTWKCTDPKNRTIELKIPLATMIAILSDDGQCLSTSTWASSAVFNRLGHVCENDQPKETSAEQKPLGL
jgi:chemotaxis protein histidine kinase CheA